jgi:hypothetical protein
VIDGNLPQTAIYDGGNASDAPADFILQLDGDY